MATFSDGSNFAPVQPLVAVAQTVSLGEVEIPEPQPQRSVREKKRPHTSWQGAKNSPSQRHVSSLTREEAPRLVSPQQTLALRNVRWVAHFSFFSPRKLRLFSQVNEENLMISFQAHHTSQK